MEKPIETFGDLADLVGPAKPSHWPLVVREEGGEEFTILRLDQETDPETKQHSVVLRLRRSSS